MREMSPEYDDRQSYPPDTDAGPLGQVDFSFACDDHPQDQDPDTDLAERFIAATGLGEDENPMATTETLEYFPGADSTDGTESTPPSTIERVSPRPRPTWESRLKPGIRLVVPGDEVPEQKTPETSNRVSSWVQSWKQVLQQVRRGTGEEIYRLGDDEIGKWLRNPDGTNPSSLEEWQTDISIALEQSAFKYDIDPQRAGEYLAAFGEGVQFVIDKFRSKGVEIEDPTIALLTRDDIFPGADFMCETTSQMILIRASALEERFNSYTTGTMLDDTIGIHDYINGEGNLNFRGTLRDEYRLAGVEETHHWVNAKFRGPGVPTVGLSSSEEHDATEPEWRALAWQIMYARHVAMPDYSIQSLVDKQTRAREYRNTHRPTTQ
ncbi:MAG TPA: hypothetical protein VF809_03360 [Candidatus Saccharimonadales bacterium]